MDETDVIRQMVNVWQTRYPKTVEFPPVVGLTRKHNLNMTGEVLPHTRFCESDGDKNHRVRTFQILPDPKAYDSGRIFGNG